MKKLKNDTGLYLKECKEVADEVFLLSKNEFESKFTIKIVRQKKLENIRRNLYISDIISNIEKIVKQSERSQDIYKQLENKLKSDNIRIELIEELCLLLNDDLNEQIK